MEVQRSGEANTATHFKDTKQANVRRLKLFRPAQVAQTGVFGIRKGELEQASSREQESKDSLNDRACEMVHVVLLLAPTIGRDRASECDIRDTSSAQSAPRGQ